MTLSAKRTLISLALGLCVCAPAFAQIGDTDIEALMKKYATGYNKGDAQLLATEVFATGDAAALKTKLDALRSEEFGKLDIYGYKTCPVIGDKTKVEMRYARIFTYGGTMNGDEVKVFELAKTPAGWRIASEADAKYESKLSCG